MATEDRRNNAMVASSKPALDYWLIDVPKPEAGQLLIQISYVAQNPTDVQSFDAAAFGDGAVYGCDFVGNVVEIGKNVSGFQLGDEVAALIWGGEVKGLGAYSNYTIADSKITFKLPSGLDPAAAATIPLALTTSWLALFSKDCLNMSRRSGQSVLIWGGSSSVGQYAIQIAALYKFNVVTTCSPKNFDLVKKLGATHVFDYKSSDVKDQIRNAAPDIKYVFDTIGSADSSATACEASASDCTMCTVRPGKGNTDNVPESVKITDVLVWTCFLKDHSYKEFKWPASPEDHELSAELYQNLPEWIKEGKIQPNDVIPLRGLQSVPEGFQMHRDGKISAQKIVYEVRIDV